MQLFLSLIITCNIFVVIFYSNLYEVLYTTTSSVTIVNIWFEVELYDEENNRYFCMYADDFKCACQREQSK
jgi:hypothetical protein